MLLVAQKLPVLRNSVGRDLLTHFYGLPIKQLIC